MGVNMSEEDVNFISVLNTADKPSSKDCLAIPRDASRPEKLAYMPSAQAMSEIRIYGNVDVPGP